MPATTRSSTKQPKLEDMKGVELEKSTKATKRKASAADSENTTRKKAKSESKPKDSGEPETKSSRKNASKPPKESTKDNNAAESNSIAINRAPVLELWSACVTHFLYPSLPWSTCLSIGGAIATITAIAKGRSIGTMEKPDPGEAEARREKRRNQAEAEALEEVDVMGFTLRIKKGQALVGEKAKKGDEGALNRKFGDEGFRLVKGVFEEVLGTWKDEEEGLERQAFHFYEDFRPSIPPGQKGWGRKGQLNLEHVASVVRREE